MFISKLFPLARLLWYGNRSVTTHVLHFVCLREQQNWNTMEYYANIEGQIECRKVKQLGIHKTADSTENSDGQRLFASVWVQVEDQVFRSRGAWIHGPLFGSPGQRLGRRAPEGFAIRRGDFSHLQLACGT